MASDPSIPPPDPASSPPSRRPSWARAFDRVRAAMRRRSSALQSLQTVQQDESSSQEPPVIPTDLSNIVTPTQMSEFNGEVIETAAEPVAPIEPENQVAESTAIEADDDDQEEADDAQDGPQIPMLSTRISLTDERARDLFAKYNIKYEHRGKRPQQEPPAKMRRVEKPVRLRVHWTCHECRAQFGFEKVCVSCGHRRCRDCVRHPPKRANAPRSQIEDEEEPVAGPAGPTFAIDEQPVSEMQDQLLDNEEQTTLDPDLQAYREEPAAAPLSQEDEMVKDTSRTSTPTATAGELLSSQPLEIDDNAEEHYAILRSDQLMTYTRPRAAIHTVMKPTKTIRRTCHECHTPLSFRSRNCVLCGHVECELCTGPNCQASISGPSKQAQEQVDEVPMVRAVKRVYRKPRQRVRYRCENCNTHFVESDRCGECGHERCHTCHRDPPKRHHRATDPELLAAVANRLAAYGGGLGQPPGITA